MFALFKNNELLDFWANKQGDIFFELTCQKLKLKKEEIDLIYFKDLEKAPDHFEFLSSKDLVIKEKHISIVQESVKNHLDEDILDEEGNPIMQDVEVVSYSELETLVPEIFVNKGTILKLC